MSLVALTVIGCGGSGNYDTALQAMNGIMAAQEDMVAALETVESPDDVPATVAQIDAATAKVQEILTTIQGLELTESETEQLEQAVRPKLTSLRKRMEVAVPAAEQNSNGSPEIQAALIRFNQMLRAMNLGQ